MFTVDFDIETDMGGFTFAQLEKVDVDSLFSFSEPLGSGYIGRWTTKSQFIVTIIDWPGAGPPQVFASHLRTLSQQCMEK